MEYCSLNDAFPAVGPTPPGCRGADGSSTARKAEHRRAKKARGPQLEMLGGGFDEARAKPNPDPDRQAERMEAPAAFQHGAGMAPSGGAGNSEGGEGFAGQGRLAPNLPQGGEGFAGMVPVVYQPVEPSNRAATNKPTPKWFGTAVGGEEGFTPYTGSLSREEDAEKSMEYMLQPSFESAFKARAADKPTGGPVLPIPNLDDRWKPMTAPAGALTAYYERFQAPAAAAAANSKSDGVSTPDVLEIKKKLDKIFARLDDMESRRLGTENSNTEVGLFVMTGVFVMFFMDLLVRKTANMRVYPA